MVEEFTNRKYKTSDKNLTGNLILSKYTNAYMQIT